MKKRTSEKIELASPLAPHRQVTGSRYITIGLSLLMASLLWVSPAAAEPAARAALDAGAAGLAAAVRVTALQSFQHPARPLLAIPHLPVSWALESHRAGDLVAAVEEGNDPSLVRRSNFRKKSFDLFRAERQVVIGRKEMRVRLRLRPKTKETMTVELKF